MTMKWHFAIFPFDLRGGLREAVPRFSPDEVRQLARYGRKPALKILGAEHASILHITQVAAFLGRINLYDDAFYPF